MLGTIAPRLGVTMIRCKRAFTLIELLVVIAIIAILAAILFPVFARAKESAQKTSDLSNFKQIMLAVLMYNTDYDDVFVMLRNGTPRWGCPGDPIVNCFQVNNGAVATLPYVKNRAIWKSPNDNIPRDDCPDRGPNTPGGELSYSFTYYRQGNIVSFGVSGWSNMRTNGTFSAGSGPSLAATAIGAPAQTIFMYPYYASFSYFNGLQAYSIDGRRPVFNDPAIYGIELWPNYNPGYYWCGPGEKIAIGGYGGQTNYAFVDGHAKSLKREQVMDRLWLTDPVTADANKAYNLMHYDEAFKNR